MTWFAIVETATGRLHATATVVADDETLAKKGLEAIPLAFNPQAPPDGGGRHEWDEATRSFTVASDLDLKERRLATLQAEVSQLSAEIAVLRSR